MTRGMGMPITLACTGAFVAVLAMLASVGASGTVDQATADRYQYWADVLLIAAILLVAWAVVSGVLRISERLDDIEQIADREN